MMVVKRDVTLQCIIRLIWIVACNTSFTTAQLYHSCNYYPDSELTICSARTGADDFQLELGVFYEGSLRRMVFPKNSLLIFVCDDFENLSAFTCTCAIAVWEPQNEADPSSDFCNSCTINDIADDYFSIDFDCSNRIYYVCASYSDTGGCISNYDPTFTPTPPFTPEPTFPPAPVAQPIPEAVPVPVPVPRPVPMTIPQPIPRPIPRPIPIQVPIPRPIPRPQPIPQPIPVPRPQAIPLPISVPQPQLVQQPIPVVPPLPDSQVIPTVGLVRPSPPTEASPPNSFSNLFMNFPILTAPYSTKTPTTLPSVAPITLQPSGVPTSGINLSTAPSTIISPVPTISETNFPTALPVPDVTDVPVSEAPQVPTVDPLPTETVSLEINELVVTLSDAGAIGDTDFLMIQSKMEVWFESYFNEVPVTRNRQQRRRGQQIPRFVRQLQTRVPEVQNMNAEFAISQYNPSNLTGVYSMTYAQSLSYNATSDAMDDGMHYALLPFTDDAYKAVLINELSKVPLMEQLSAISIPQQNIIPPSTIPKDETSNNEKEMPLTEKGISSAALYGIVIGATVIFLVGGFVAYLRWKATSRSKDGKDRSTTIASANGMISADTASQQNSSTVKMPTPDEFRNAIEYKDQARHVMREEATIPSSSVTESSNKFANVQIVQAVRLRDESTEAGPTVTTATTTTTNLSSNEC